MLQVPRIPQPDDVTCLPACVRAVLAYWGQSLSDAEAAALCRTFLRGTLLDVAVRGLADAGIDADLRQFDSTDELAELLDEGRPVIVILRHPAGGLHAVVVCDVDASVVTIMDPAVADYRTLPLSRFEDLWCRVHNEGLIVGSRPAK